MRTLGVIGVIGVIGIIGLLTSLAGCQAVIDNTLGNSGTGGAGAGGARSGGTGGATAAGATGAAGQSGSAALNPLTQDLIDAFVEAHNQARGGPLTPPPSPPLPPVGWDPILADTAYQYALGCQGSDGLLNHNANRTADYAALGGSGYVGENIYGSSGLPVSPEAAVSSWMSEASSYDYNSGDFGDAGHYTQIVWRATVRIGCAIVDCPALRYHNTVICDYAPGGNIVGEKPY